VVPFACPQTKVVDVRRITVALYQTVGTAEPGGERLPAGIEAPPE